MATIGDITGSSFIGCPITVLVTSATIADAATFRRVRLVVTVSQDGAVAGDFEFSTPVNRDNETVEFDVSSALRAVAEQYQYEIDSAGAFTYPIYTIVLDAYDDYMVDGESYEKRYPYHKIVSDGFYQGALTDRERLSGARPSRYSRKPTSSKEIVFIGSEHITPGPTSAAPSAQCDVVTAGSSLANVYPVAIPTDGYELRFINSLGIHESLCISCLRSEETPITSNSYVVAKQETLTKFSRSVTKKQDDREEWKLSSGPLDQAWLYYFIHEVLMAEIASIKVNGLWLPIEIQSDEAVVGVDRVKASMMEVQFKVKFGINGSPW